VEATTSIIEQDRESRIRERLTNSGKRMGGRTAATQNFGNG
jgi:hypothetical protein